MKASFEGVGFRYGAAAALEDVSFDVPDGAVTVVIGPSGAGKTTLLHLAAGLLRPAAGAIRFDGRDVGAIPAERRDVGMVFQSYALFPHLTVAENIAFGLRYGRRRAPGNEIERRVAETAALVDVTPLLARTPDALSGGEQQRVALARAVAPRPSLLLLDEPFSAIDAMLRRSLRTELRTLLGRIGITTLYVTHDQEEAMLLADRLVVLRAGRVEQEGPPLDAYRRPRSRFVASFLGEANLLPGEIASADPAAGRAAVRTGLGEIRIASSGDPAGTRGALLVRPEDLAPGEDGAAARVVEARDLGSHLRVIARLDSGERVIARLAPGADAAAGSTLRLAVIAGRGHFLRDGA
ncbi:MAG: ABC transporter ATP-binding protein [Hyphomicrobiales bacterium]